MRTLLLFLAMMGAMLGTCSAQFSALSPFAPPLPVVAGGVSTNYPTNFTGCIGWWVADSAITNTSGQVTNLPDLWVNGWHLTNTTTGTAPYITNNALNGHAVISFDGVDDFLRAAAFTNSSANVMETFYVMKYNGTTNIATIAYWLGSVSATFRMHSGLAANTGNRLLNIGGLGSVAMNKLTTNVWLVNNDIFSGSSGDGGNRTNNVRDYSTLASSSSTASGLTLANAATLVTPAKVIFAEVAIYSATNGALTRSNLYNYFTNKYGTF